MRRWSLRCKSSSLWRIVGRFRLHADWDRSIDAATPTWADMNTQLGFSYAILNDSYAIGCGTLCIGAFILIPFALKYGRRPIYLVSTLLQCAISIWTARLQNVADLLLVNALSCGLGALAEVIVQMTVADVFFVHQRGITNTVYVWISAIGGQLTPIPSGYITVSQGWRWVWWWCAILFGLTFLLFLFCFEESKYAKVDEDFTLTEVQDPLAEMPPSSNDEESKTMTPDLIGEKSATSPVSDLKAEEAKGNPDLALNSTTLYQLKTYRQRMALWETSPGPWSSFFLHSYQPVMILITIPAVGYMSFVYGMVNVAQTMTITVLSIYMADAPYNFNASQIGLMSLPSFIGTTIGALICGPLSDRIILYLARRNKGIYEPEMRLWLIIAFIPFVPAGLLTFGLGLNAGVQWPIVAFGYGLVAFGITAPSSIALTYITDAYTEVRDTDYRSLGHRC